MGEVNTGDLPPPPPGARPLADLPPPPSDSTSVVDLPPPSADTTAVARRSTRGLVVAALVVALVAGGLAFAVSSWTGGPTGELVTAPRPARGSGGEPSTTGVTSTGVTTTATPPTSAAPTSAVAPSSAPAPASERPVVELPDPTPEGCHPSYTPCIPLGIEDVDCAGTGNGPRFVDGPVTVSGRDDYLLDPDGDGRACT